MMGFGVVGCGRPCFVDLDQRSDLGLQARVMVMLYDSVQSGRFGRPCPLGLGLEVRFRMIGQIDGYVI